MRYGQREIKNTQLRYHGGLTGGFILSPLCIPRLLLKLVIGYGISMTRLSDPWNDYDELKGEVEELRGMGMTSVVNLIYSISPRHTDEYYARKAREAAAMKPYRLCFKDVAGMLTPDRTYSLAKLILANVGDVPVEFHAHCNNGLAPFNVLEAVKAGIRIVHTAIPPLANGSAQPSVFNVVNNLRALGYQPLVNENVLVPVEAHLRYCAKDAGLPVGAPREYDEGWYRHQVPGGMISNLRHQLKLLGKEDKMSDVLEEIVQVRAELGYPIMVTPFAQFVGSQAAINIMTGERYKEVTDQVIQFALGLWGKEGALYMDREVKAKILDRKRSRRDGKLSNPQHAIGRSQKPVRRTEDIRRRTDHALLRRPRVRRRAKNRAAAQGISRRENTDSKTGRAVASETRCQSCSYTKRGILHLGWTNGVKV